MIWTILKWVVTIPLGLLVLVYFGSDGWHQAAVVTDFRTYLDAIESDPSNQVMIRWAQEMPLWRMIVWGGVNVTGVLAGLAMLARLRASIMLVAVNVLLSAVGLAGDYFLLDAFNQLGVGYFMYMGAAAGLVLLVGVLARLVARGKAKPSDAIPDAALQAA